MKSVRIKPVLPGTLLVGITCQCGDTVHTNVASGEVSFNHAVKYGGDIVDLRCKCGKTFRLVPQNNHVHVNEVK